MRYQHSCMCSVKSDEQVTNLGVKQQRDEQSVIPPSKQVSCTFTESDVGDCNFVFIANDNCY